MTEQTAVVQAEPDGKKLHPELAEFSREELEHAFISYMGDVDYAEGTTFVWSLGVDPSTEERIAAIIEKLYKLR